MKHPWISLFLGLVCAVSPVFSADQDWQVGRILSVQRVDQSKTLYWIANTPVSQDQTLYAIIVHLQDKIYYGSYTPAKSSTAPPEIWVKEHPVRVQIAGESMYLRTPAGPDLKVNIVKKKSAPMMRVITPAELADLNNESSLAPSSQQPSMIGFDQPSEKAQASAATASEAAAPPAAEPSQATLSVTSTPYLAEVFVDGNSVGYTPAKVHLPAGKHVIRLEKNGYKPWSKEVTLTEGTELPLDANLEHKPK